MAATDFGITGRIAQARIEVPAPGHLLAVRGIMTVLAFGRRRNTLPAYCRRGWDLRRAVTRK